MYLAQMKDWKNEIIYLWYFWRQLSVLWLLTVSMALRKKKKGEEWVPNGSFYCLSLMTLTLTM